MTAVRELVIDAARAGIWIGVDADDLVLRGKLLPELVATLQRRKPEVLAALQMVPTGPERRILDGIPEPDRARVLRVRSLFNGRIVSDGLQGGNGRA